MPTTADCFAELADRMREAARDQPRRDECSRERQDENGDHGAILGGDDAREIGVGAADTGLACTPGRCRGPVAPVERDGVEHVAEHPQLREHQHTRDRRVAGKREHLVLHVPAVEVVAVVQRHEVPTVVREGSQPAVELR